MLRQPLFATCDMDLKQLRDMYEQMKIKCKSKTIKKIWKLERLCEFPICTYCRQMIGKYKKATIDHVVPISKGGMQLGQKNWVLCCKACNEEKANMDSELFVEIIYKRYGKFQEFFRTNERPIGFDEQEHSKFPC